jgi:hypothetical protein
MAVSCGALRVLRLDPVGASLRQGAASWRQRPVCPPDSFAVAASLLPAGGFWNGAGPAEAIRQAGDQGVCGVEVRGFEPLASSVRGIFRQSSDLDR